MMEQKCKNCKWEKAPCGPACRTFRNNEELSASGFHDHWTPAKPWEDKWVVPEGCHIVGLYSDELTYVGRVSFAEGAVCWNVGDGKCFDSNGASPLHDLIPKAQPIEETEEFKAFCEWANWDRRNMKFKMSMFKELQKVFKMELK